MSSSTSRRAVEVAAQRLAKTRSSQDHEWQTLRERQAREIAEMRRAQRDERKALHERHAKRLAAARAAVPRLSDDQWGRIAHLLQTDDPKWRAKIDDILEMQHGLSWLQWCNAARKRDLDLIERISKLTQKLEFLLGNLEIVQVDDILDAAASCVDRLGARHAETLNEHKRSSRDRFGDRFVERDLCVSFLIDLWNEARTGSTDGLAKVGDKAGPLVRYLREAYRPIGTLSPEAAREIARLPRRKSRGVDALLSRTLLWMDWMVEKDRQDGDQTIGGAAIR
jgi:hypothetical protein